MFSLEYGFRKEDFERFMDEKDGGVKENQREKKMKRTDKGKIVDIGNIIRNIGMEKLLIIAICGVVLVILSVPGDNKKKESSNTKSVQDSEEKQIGMSTDEYCSKLEERLQELISKIDGVEQVHVMITLKCGSESVVLTEVAYEQSEKKDTGNNGVVSEQSDYKNESVVVYEKDGDGNTTPYVIKENVPQIEGIAVIAKGGDNPENILKITSIAQALFNVEAHKISVIGMR